MKLVPISVTEAARNFADCVNRVRYQQTTFVLLKNGKAVGRIVPAEPRPKRGRELAAALREALKDVNVAPNEAKAWLHDLDDRGDRLPGSKWQS